MSVLKKLYLFLNRHMKTLALIWVATLVPVAVVPDLGYVVAALVAALCILMHIGDYPCNWIAEVDIK